jgi:2-C-methyl-D-erythritol 4-phosphate cytidylyltransferase / 2-C-methyl-D-erythritol 2,4-cyclodiphosphate synthase
MHVTAIIAAGGRGLRLGAGQPKQLVSVGGRSILERSVTAFHEHPDVNEIIVSLPAELAAAPPEWLQRMAKPARIVTGGARRQDSVANAFAAVNAASDVVVIHDAARPFVSRDLITRTIAAALADGAAVAALAAKDTVKVADAGAYVLRTVPRETVFLAQTPQAFRREVLAESLANGGDATDEAMLAERAGHKVRIVQGDAINIKITTADDLRLADAIVSRSIDAPRFRSGTGYDLHRLVPGRPLLIGGVHIPFDKGALGHSDADVVCHAVTDAVLGGAGLGDIGRHFPDDDPRWKDAASLDLLARAAALVGGHGFAVNNIDATVILERPKIKDHIETMRANVARALGIEMSQVSIKGKTNEGVDAVGRGEAIAAHAVALVCGSVRGEPRTPSESPSPDPDSRE